jgi:hypothetical protein
VGEAKGDAADRARGVVVDPHRFAADRAGDRARLGLDERGGDDLDGPLGRASSFECGEALPGSHFLGILAALGPALGTRFPRQAHGGSIPPHDLLRHFRACMEYEFGMRPRLDIPTWTLSASLLIACGSSPHSTAPDASARDAEATDTGSPHLDAETDTPRDTGAREDSGTKSRDAQGDGTTDAACGPTPPGATALGYETEAFCLLPTTADISYTSTPDTKLYSGMFYESMPPDATHYSMVDGVLAVSLGGLVATQRLNSTEGELPYLLAGKGFYAEFAVTLSDNDADHWPAVWLMPREHNLAQSDHLASDPPGYERWMEIDCDEGGFYSGSLHSLIDWQGIYPHYMNTTWNNYGAAPTGLDRTVEHIFGVSYNPVGQVAQYWLDGAKAFAHSTSTISTIVNTYHYYLIMNAASHSANTPYEMKIRYASAWIP